MKNKYIFDLDGTLINGDYSKEKEYFKSILTTSDSEKFIPQISKLLEQYEIKHKRYDINLLAEFLSHKSHVKITPNMIEGWIEINQDMDGTVIDGVVEVLEELKMRDKELVVLTNWFSKTQIERLKNSKLDIYFDEVYGGELFLKPNKNAYINACGYTPIELSIMIGDTYEKDYIGPKRIGLDSILYDPECKVSESKDVVKNLRKIKDIY